MCLRACVLRVAAAANASSAHSPCPNSHTHNTPKQNASPDYVASVCNEAGMRRDALRGQVPRTWLVRILFSSRGGGQRLACLSIFIFFDLETNTPNSHTHPLKHTHTYTHTHTYDNRWEEAPAPSPTAGSTCGGTACSGSAGRSPARGPPCRRTCTGSSGDSDGDGDGDSGDDVEAFLLIFSPPSPQCNHVHSEGFVGG